MTSLNAERKKAQNSQRRRTELFDNLEHGDNILQLHADLQKLADELDEKVESRLNANETAFFLAYKNFMYTVQKEFKELKQKADEEETKTRRDAKIQSLEKELDWFMHEALRLDELCKKHKKDLDKWKSKAETLEDDRQLLENSIKTAKKNNKTLRGMVEKAQTTAYSALANTDLASKQAIVSVPPAQQEQPLAVEDRRPLALEAPSGLSKELEERYQGCVQKLKQQLEAEQRQAAKLRAVSDRQLGDYSELEEIFVGFVDRIKLDIVDRRRQTEASRQPQKKGKRPSESSHGKASTGAAVSVDDFTVSDRRKVVELLLGNDVVLQFLYDKLFPPAVGDGLNL